VIQDLQFAGEDWEEKVDRLRTNLVENKYFGMIVTELDEIAWLFNIRG
jgi:Xaa-Pro aminopeptidase